MLHDINLYGEKNWKYYWTTLNGIKEAACLFSLKSLLMFYSNKLFAYAMFANKLWVWVCRVISSFGTKFIWNLRKESCGFLGSGYETKEDNFF